MTLTVMTQCVLQNYTTDDGGASNIMVNMRLLTQASPSPHSDALTKTEVNNNEHKSMLVAIRTL